LVRWPEQGWSAAAAGRGGDDQGAVGACEGVVQEGGGRAIGRAGALEVGEVVVERGVHDGVGGRRGGARRCVAGEIATVDLGAQCGDGRRALGGAGEADRVAARVQ
jgi:hypothetical protein